MINIKDLTPENGFEKGVTVKVEYNDGSTEFGIWEEPDFTPLYCGFFLKSSYTRLDIVKSIIVLTGPMSIWNHAPDWAEYCTRDSDSITWWSKDVDRSRRDIHRPFWAERTQVSSNDTINNTGFTKEEIDNLGKILKKYRHDENYHISSATWDIQVALGNVKRESLDLDAVTLSKESFNDMVALRDEYEDLIEDVAHYFGCNKEWSSGHSHYSCVKDYIRNIVVAPAIPVFDKNNPNIISKDYMNEIYLQLEIIRNHPDAGYYIKECASYALGFWNLMQETKNERK